MTGSKHDFLKSLQNIKVNPNLAKLFLPIRIVLGVFLICFGIVGIILPGLPGWTPLILGVMIISPYHGKELAKWVYSIYKKYIVKLLMKRD